MARSQTTRTGIALGLALALAPVTAAASPYSMAPRGVLNPAAKAAVNAGIAAYERGAYADALRHFEEAEHQAPDWHPIHFNQAASAEALGRLDYSAKKYQTYVTRHGPTQSVSKRLGSVNARRKDAYKVPKRQLAIGGTLVAVGGLMALVGGILIAAENGVAGGAVLGTGLAVPLPVGIAFLARGAKNKKVVRTWLARQSAIRGAI